MRHCWLAVVLGVVAVLVTGVAQAGPPYVTDDPETPEEGCWEVNTPYGFERSNGLEQVQEPLLDINYGYRSNLQLKLELPLLHVSGPGQPSTTGVGGTWVGAKWRFAEQTANRPAIAVYPQLSLPTGDAGRGLGAGKSSYVLPLEAERTLGPWTAIANVGRVWQTADHT
ncbi:MAG: transporter, partial [Armatimonadota bacterium]